MCTLRVSGENFDAESYLATRTDLEPCAVFWPGVPAYDQRVSRGRGTQRGFHVGVSNCEWADWAGQVSDAISFLEEHQEVLSSLSEREDVDSVTLDFPSDMDPETRSLILWDQVLPVPLLRAAANAGVDLKVTVYVAGDEAEPDKGAVD